MVNLYVPTDTSSVLCVKMRPAMTNSLAVELIGGCLHFEFDVPEKFSCTSWPMKTFYSAKVCRLVLQSSSISKSSGFKVVVKTSNKYQEDE